MLSYPKKNLLQSKANYYCKFFCNILTIYCKPQYVKITLDTQWQAKSKWISEYVGHCTTSAATNVEL